MRTSNKRNPIQAIAKLGIVCTMLFAFTLSANAQINLGVKAGLNMNKVELDVSSITELKDANGENTAGFFAGLTADVTLPIVGLGADISVLYDQKKIKYENGEEEQKLEYISLPINLKYTIGLSSLASIYVATGPQFSFNVGSKKFEAYKDKSMWELKKSEFSWNVGGGLTVFSHVRIGYNYNIAMGSTAEISLPNVTDKLKDKLTNNTHQVSISYLF